MSCRMKTTLVLSALLLSASALAFVPVASADHCFTQPAVAEVRCQVNHVVDDWEAFVLCFFNTPPNAWFVVCAPLT